MADTPKVLGQAAPAATSETDLYTVPGATSAVASTLSICNTNASPTTVRISVAVAAAATVTKQYVFYELPVEAEDTFVATVGLTLAATDVVRVYAADANVAFQLFGVEKT